MLLLATGLIEKNSVVGNRSARLIPATTAYVGGQLQGLTDECLAFDVELLRQQRVTGGEDDRRTQPAQIART